jgi:hypothetical protein
VVVDFVVQCWSQMIKQSKLVELGKIAAAANHATYS